jgi:hypothetical protein
MDQRFLARKNSESTVREFGDILDPGMAEQSIRDRAEMILSVDESLGAIFAELEESGRLDTTAIVLTSDNGFFFGEHGLSVERRLPYEESIRSSRTTVMIDPSPGFWTLTIGRFGPITIS